MCVGGGGGGRRGVQRLSGMTGISRTFGLFWKEKKPVL